MWDDNNIYVGFRLEEEQDYSPSGEVLERDHMRSPSHSATIQFASAVMTPREIVVDINGNYNDMIFEEPWDKWNAEGIEITNHVEGNVWSVMITIPMKSFAIEPFVKELNARIMLNGKYTLNMAYGDPVGWPVFNFTDN